LLLLLMMNALLLHVATDTKQELTPDAAPINEHVD
jgi:hypothetical protein